MTAQLKPDGLFIASIRDYDSLLQHKPAYSPPYIHPTAEGQRVSFQTWEWDSDLYHLTQYIITDEASLQISKFTCDYRAVCRDALAAMLQAAGCRSVQWHTPEETGFYQPIVTARKGGYHESHRNRTGNDQNHRKTRI
jgi:hypothetical protein